jgi:hypothetical protein
MFSRLRELTTRSTVQASATGKSIHKVLMYEREARNIANLTLQYPDIETGGSLFGYWTHSGAPVVALAIGPGRRSRHAATSFHQDEDYLHHVGIALYDRHGLQHIGEWHSHHQLGLNKPSTGDINTVRLGMEQRGWSRFVLLITTIDDVSQGMVLQNYFLFHSDGIEPLRVLPMPGSSPHRTGEFVAQEEPTTPVLRMSWRPGPFTPGTESRIARATYPDAWFTTEKGRTLLIKAERDFEAAGIDCRMVVHDEGPSLELRLGEASLMLGPQFPNEAPKWVGPAPSPEFGPWSASTDLVAWYREAIVPSSQTTTSVTTKEEAGNGYY